MRVESHPRDLLQNRYQRLGLRGLQVRLRPASEVEPPDRPLPTIAELLLEPATIRVDTGSGQDDLKLQLNAIVHNIGTGELPRPLGPRADGELRLSAGALDLQPFYALFGGAAPPVRTWIVDFELKLTFDLEGTELVVDASSAQLEDTASPTPRSLELSSLHLTAEQRDRRVDLELTADEATATLDSRQMTSVEPSATVSMTQAADSAWNVELTPRLGGLNEGRLRGAWCPTLKRLTRFDGWLRGLDLASLLPDSGLRAAADVEISADGDRVEGRLDILPQQLMLADDRYLSDLEGAKVQIRGHLPLDLATLRIPAWRGPLTVQVDIPTGRGRWRSWSLPPNALPLAASFSGRWQGLETPRVFGESRLEFPAGRLTTQGELAMSTSPESGGRITPHADLTWAWKKIDLEPLARLLRAAGVGGSRPRDSRRWRRSRNAARNYSQRLTRGPSARRHPRGHR